MKPSIHNYSGLRPVHGKARALFAASSLGILLALPAGAATIAISNHSFEDPVLTEEDLSITTTGWTFFTGGSGGAGRVIFNPTDTWFSGSTGGTPAGADGMNVLNTYTGAALGDIAGVHQTIAGTLLTAGQTYTMTVAIGDYKSLTPNRWHLAISTSSMGVGSYLVDYSPTNGNTLLTNDAFTDFSVQYTATGLESQIDENLRITIWSQNHGEGGTHVAFDNVRLTAIPEPSAALLGGLGCLLLLRRRSR